MRVAAGPIPGEAERTAALLAEVAAWRPRPCGGCGTALCHHGYVLNAALGFKDRPRCVACLAGALARERHAFLVHALEHVQGRECFRTAWGWASATEGAADPVRPACLFPAGIAPAATAPAAAGGTAGAPAADDRWDAGDLSCGDLVLELRLRVRALAPGQVLHVTATDPSAPADLPAWCRLTGHALAHEHHPHYWIRRKEA